MATKFRYLGTVLIWLLASQSIHAQKIDLREGLVARYLFELDANNWIKNAHHGNTFNLSYASDRFGNPDACASFNGIDARIVIPHSEELDWDARSESYSIAFWVKSDDPNNGNSNSKRLLNKWSEYLSEPYPYAIHIANGRLTANIFSTQEGASCIYPDPWDNEWHLVVMVSSHTDKLLSIYLDAQLVESTPLNFNHTTKNTHRIDIGHSHIPGREGFYKGLLDDLYFYERALSLCEIEALYSNEFLNER